jgi:serine/threonine protein kinase
LVGFHKIKKRVLGIGREIGEGELTIIGTLVYMAPEVKNMSKYSFAADIWSLGITLFELLSLRKAAQIAHSASEQDFSSIPHLYSEELRNLVPQLLKINPKERITHKQLKSKYVEKNIVSLKFQRNW